MNEVHVVTVVSDVAVCNEPPGLLKQAAYSKKIFAEARLLDLFGEIHEYDISHMLPEDRRVILSDAWLDGFDSVVYRGTITYYLKTYSIGE